MTVALSTMRAVMCAWKSSPTAMGSRGRHGADAAQQLALAVVHVLGDHRAVQREERGVAAAADGADDGVAHVLVGRALDVAGRVRAGGDGDDDLGAHLLRHLEEPAELRVGVAELLDRGGAGERPEGGERRGHGREGIGLVHHHRDHDLAASHRHMSIPPLTPHTWPVI